MNDLMVMTQIAGRRCALPAHGVQSMIEIGAITPVPRTPEYIFGITAMRSQALTVIDSRLALGFPRLGWSTDRRAAVISVDGHSYALMVDAIEDIATSITEPEQVSGGFGDKWSRVAVGMIETDTGPALLVDLTALIAGPEEDHGNISAAA